MERWRERGEEREGSRRERDVSYKVLVRVVSVPGAQGGVGVDLVLVSDDVLQVRSILHCY